jgi:hypothetical protein
MTAAPPNVATSQPRRRWRRIAAVLVFTAFVALWLVWWQIAHARLQARVSAIQAAGESLNPAQIRWRPTPTTLPTGTFFHRALAAMSTTQQAPSTLEGLSSATPPYPPKWHAAAEQAISANLAAFSLARKARNVDEPAWAFIDLNPARFFFNRHRRCRGPCA